jgi:cytochrome c oxidase cbb3-type subunit 3
MPNSRNVIALLFLAAPFLILSCKREQRGFRVDPPSAEAVTGISLSDLHAGPGLTNAPVKNELEENAYAISQGQRLYNYFNCVGCHAHGGGDKGPPFIDQKWIYGANPENVFASIVQGRPNGMPSYSGRIAENQIREIVAYVRSLSGQVSKQAAPGRDEHMQTGPAPNSVKPESPTSASVPKSAEAPE